jgi:hypothetical protein
MQRHRKDLVMNNLTRTALAAGAAVTLMAGVSSLSVSAAPLAANSELKAAVTSNTIDVQRRWHRRRAAIALGAFGVGVAAGAALSNRGYYYDQPYGYYEQPYGYYEQPYGYTYYGSPYADPYGGNY